MKGVAAHGSSVSQLHCSYSPTIYFIPSSREHLGTPSMTSTFLSSSCCHCAGRQHAHHHRRGRGRSPRHAGKHRCISNAEVLDPSDLEVAIQNGPDAAGATSMIVAPHLPTDEGIDSRLLYIQQAIVREGRSPGATSTAKCDADISLRSRSTASTPSNRASESSAEERTPACTLRSPAGFA
eukprot:scaffold576_cov260-Pinguiococcus_pyrenoidosus.AAC.20